MDKRNTVIVSDATKRRIKKLADETRETEGRIVAIAMSHLIKSFPTPHGDLVEQVYTGEIDVE